MQVLSKIATAQFQPDDDLALQPVDGLMRSELVRRLFEKHNRALIRFLAAKLSSEAEAQEVAQEAYVRLLRLEDASAMSFLRAHLFSIAANLAVDRLRHRQVRERNAPQDMFEDLLTRPGPDREVLGQQELEVVKAALKKLPEKCRRAFLLHVFEGHSVREIAETMQLTDRMIRHYVARALTVCRECLDETKSL